MFRFLTKKMSKQVLTGSFTSIYSSVDLGVMTKNPELTPVKGLLQSTQHLLSLEI
jgi:hypothetical protein